MSATYRPMSRIARGEQARSYLIPYTVFRQSRDYLYGWNWRHDETGKKGLGYQTKASATEAAVQHHETGRK